MNGGPVIHVILAISGWEKKNKKKPKNTEDHIEKKDHKNEECKIILTDNDSLTMSSSQFTANKNQQKILGKKNQWSRKTK